MPSAAEKYMKVLFVFTILIVFGCLKMEYAVAQMFHEGIVTVSSEYQDMTTTENHLLTGVGTIIQKGDSFFILTAGHVAKGTSVQVKLSGETIPWDQIFFDDENDLSLIKLSGYVRVIPLGVVSKKRGELMRSFVIPGGRIENPENPRQLVMTPTNIMTGVKYKAYALESFVENYSSHQPLRTQQNLLFVPWDAALKPFRNVDEKYSGTDPVNLKQEYLDYSMVPGFSGAPVMSSFQYDVGEIYHLIGIMISSTEGIDGKATFVPWNRIYPFIDNPREKETSLWLFIDGNFTRWNKNSTVEVFTDNHPIGNSIIIYGRTTSSDEIAERRGSIEKKLQALEYKKNDVDVVQNLLPQVRSVPRDEVIKKDGLMLRKK